MCCPDCLVGGATAQLAPEGAAELFRGDHLVILDTSGGRDEARGGGRAAKHPGGPAKGIALEAVLENPGQCRFSGSFGRNEDAVAAPKCEPFFDENFIISVCPDYLMCCPDCLMCCPDHLICCPDCLMCCPDCLMCCPDCGLFNVLP